MITSYQENNSSDSRSGGAYSGNVVFSLPLCAVGYTSLSWSNMGIVFGVLLLILLVLAYKIQVMKIATTRATIVISNKA